MHLWYDRDGNKITAQEWERLAIDFNYVRVARTRVTPMVGEHAVGATHPGGEVSTRWMGTHMGILDGGPPLIFETMVFLRNTNQVVRSSREDQARAAHETEVCRLIAEVCCPVIEEIQDVGLPAGEGEK